MITIALVVAVVAALVLIRLGDEWVFCGVIGALLAIAIGITSIGFVYMGWRWLASEKEVAIINREYKTNYTREEVFWARNVIDTIRKIDRQRVEVNGNIMRDAKRRDQVVEKSLR